MRSNAGLDLSEELDLRRTSAGILAGIAFAALAACGGGGGGDGATPPPAGGGAAGGSTPPPAASAPAVGSATLGAAGGEVTTADRTVTLRVPANTVSASTMFSIVQAPADAASGVVGGRVASLSPAGATFAAPVEIAYQYDPSWLAEEWSASALALARWTGTGWSTVPTTVNVQAKTLNAKVSAFSTWAPVVQSGTNSSPDYTWEVSENCLRTTDSAYNQKLARLGLTLFGVEPGPSVGCVTGPYLENGYSKFIASMQHHAGLDFRASEGTKVYAPADGNVVFQALDAAAGASTLTIESSVDGVVYRLAFLHCMSHEQVRGGVSLGNLAVGSSVKTGDQVCKAGKVGAFASHLHFEVKRTTQDAGNLKAMSGSRGSCASSSFVGGWNSETSAYDLPLTSPGCSLADIRSGSVDPISLLQAPPTASELDSVKLYAHTESMYVIKSDGSMWAWGANGAREVGDPVYAGQLGDGTNTSKFVPVKIGDNFDRLVAVDLRRFALKKDGSVWAWGENSRGFLGDGTKNYSHSPVRILNDVTDLTSANWSTYAIKRDGSIWGWGQQGYCNSDGSFTHWLSPTRVPGRFSQVSASDEMVHAISPDGGLWGWGDGVRSCVPVLIGTGYKQVFGAKSGVYAIKTDNSLWAWGWNFNAGTGNEVETTPQRLLGSVVSVQRGQHYFVHALTSDGSLWGWGADNEYGQVGNGARNQAPTKLVKVGSGFSQLFEGGYYSAAAGKSDGSVWMWGWNRNSWFGDGFGEFVATPTKVHPGKPFVKVAVGEGTAIGLTADGRVWSWGVSTTGDGVTFRRVTDPIPVMSAIAR